MTRLSMFFAQLQRGNVNLPGGGSLDQDTVNRVRGIALVIFGGIALIMMSYAGFKYISSQGNPQETAKAQNTIIYTLVGLVVAIFAVGIISFVVNRL